MPPQTCHIEADHFYDLLILGAGPCGLALASRLQEQHPAALYSDAEHARMVWLKRRGNFRQNKGRNRELVDKSAKVPAGKKRILVLDESAANGQWLSKWKTSFEQLDIKTLRSPLHFHPAPGDNDALRCYALSQADRLQEVTPLSLAEKTRKTRKNLSTKERQINERDRRDYQTTSSGLFLRFCQEQLIDRYNLGGLVQQGQVVDIAFGEDLLHVSDGSGRHTGFCIETADGRRFGAKAVVACCGGTGSPAVPLPFVPHISSIEGPGWTHSARFYQPDFCFPPRELIDRPSKLVIVGGGLTSAQIADLAVRRGVKDVVLVCRSKLKVKPFDVPIEWVAKFSSVMKATFWQTSDVEERLALIRAARAGGSVTPAFSSVLHKHVAAGRLTLLTETNITHVTQANRQWTMAFESNGAMRTMDNIDHVVLATGSKLDIDSVPWLSTLRAEGLLQNELGFPAVNEDLQVRQSDGSPGCPLFFAGAYAALQLGPAGFNLAGAREGAERIAHRLAELSIFDGADGEGYDAGGREALAALSGNLFDLLSENV